MTQRIEAIVSEGILRPLEPLRGFTEAERVSVLIESHPPHRPTFADCIGTLPDSDAREMAAVIEDEFERIDEDAWR